MLTAYKCYGAVMWGCTDQLYEGVWSKIISITRCSMRETRETALLHVACGKPARRRYCMHGCKVHAYSYIQQSGRSVKTMNAKNTKKSPIHENVDANITCDFGDGDISRSRSRLPHTRTDGQTDSHIVSSIIVRWGWMWNLQEKALSNAWMALPCKTVTYT